MNRIRTLLVPGAAMALLLTGCIRYLEEPTPAGRVPPVSPTVTAPAASTGNAREQSDGVARQEQVVSRIFRTMVDE